MNKLVRHNLVRGIPTKCFENDHTCTAFLKRKQHKASLTNDFFRFTWTFFLKTKDETSGILKKFITEIENLKDLTVKIIRCDNGGEFRNKEMNDFCSQKGIKREFSNARTPQQNGVAERRNRTLIEAARTMLAYAKLPVTFWAKAVNTACYVQNRVLINKSHNKTSYELFNGRSPAIGILKSFGCHVMILNTLDNLGKFEKKRDEGYFIGYSMSSKAFRVFNKRTRRVEENLHVEFLENKAIEKGVGPNWLFDIDSLTISMNYVPVDAGTISTNILGTKNATSQEVKKDVSSLRYIALPNCAHDALLESSLSKPQDHCSTKVPKSSRNTNPTASTSNPLAEHIETLTVESPIPTVSSLVPTACFTDSQEPSSDARLISKRVANEVETPSLDNILTLTNRFEDILRVTTNSDEANGVEADDLEFPAKVYKVEKEMYGSHQAPRAWYEFEALMHDKFQMSVMGELNFFLGLQVLQKEDGIFLSQDKYVGDILKKFGYLDVRSSNTFMDKENPWGKDRTGKDVDLHLYRSMIRSLIPTDNAAGIKDNDVDENIVYGCADDPNMPDLEEIGRFSDAENDDSGADINKLYAYFQVSHVPTTRIQKDHPFEQVIRDLHSSPQTRRISKTLERHGLVNTFNQRTNHKDIQNCLFASF
nr:hypothetical protein [Tanacetum cinerariifolium]